MGRRPPASNFAWPTSDARSKSSETAAKKSIQACVGVGTVDVDLVAREDWVEVLLLLGRRRG